MTETTGILCLDLATWTGWAHWRPGMERPRSGVLRLPKTGENVGRFLKHLHNWVVPFCKLEGIDMVIYEAPILHMGKTTPETVIKLMNLAGHTEFICELLKIRTCLSVNNATVRKHFTGRGAGPSEVMKQGVVLGCERRNWPVDDDNEADACAILDYGVHTLGIAVPWDCSPCSGPLFNRPGKVA